MMTSTRSLPWLVLAAAFVLVPVGPVNSFSILSLSSSSSGSTRSRPSRHGGFWGCSSHQSSATTRHLLWKLLSSSSSSDDSDSSSSSSSSSSSRLEGNQRIPKAEELALMDEMIDKLVDAKPYELPGAVKRAFQVIRSPQFFLRIAERSDQAEAQQDKERLQTLAANLVSTVEAVVETTKEQLDERANFVQRVVAAAAEPDSGEFYVPLSADRIEAMQTAMKEVDESFLDEGFLSTLDSWIVKSHQDGMDLMVGILQKALQIYAGLQIVRALERKDGGDSSSSSSLSPELKDLLESDTELWESRLMASGMSMDDVASVKKQVQRTMETVILALETGSMAQQVQAEYLKELLDRIEAAEAKKSV